MKVHYKKPKLNNKYEHIFPLHTQKAGHERKRKALPFCYKLLFLWIIKSYCSFVNIITFLFCYFLQLFLASGSSSSQIKGIHILLLKILLLNKTCHVRCIEPSWRSAIYGPIMHSTTMIFD